MVGKTLKVRSGKKISPPSVPKEDFPGEAVVEGKPGGKTNGLFTGDMRATGVD